MPFPGLANERVAKFFFRRSGSLPLVSVCSTAGFLQQPQTLVSIVVVLSGLQGFRAHRSVSALSWADSALSQREGQWLERVMLVQANVSALHAPS